MKTMVFGAVAIAALGATLAGAITLASAASRSAYDTERGGSASETIPSAELARWQREAQDVTITRDDWGIAHIHGKTDAEAVFGMEYAQAEDDFHRVEMNYINGLGRLAEAEGQSKIYQDLREKLFIDANVLKADYNSSPDWLKKLMDAFADGLNFYLYKHPAVKPKVLRHFEPWMALSFTEGSIGGDIERVNLNPLAAFYGASPDSQKTSSVGAAAASDSDDDEPGGSNGMAIAPANTVAHHALLLINPHTSFYFRSELQMSSDEGLNAYGAVTWGQFFVYQGFNQHAGWMHTSSGVSAVTQYLETVTKKDGRFYYQYGGEQRPMTAQEIIVPYTTDHGMAEQRFMVYRTPHGPVIGETGGKWLTFRLMQEPVKQLMQSFLRTKAKDYQSFRETMELRANSSNNTIFADADGDIAYFHGNFIPRRDGHFDWSKPVDGSDPRTDWQGLLTVEETPHLLNPASGWIYNSNDWPWAAAGPSSPKREDYPAYVETGGESARGRHAVRVLENKRDFTLSSLLQAAYDSYLTWFEKPIPALVKAWENTAESDPLKAKLAEPVGLLRRWDLRWSASSVPTSLAVFWAEDIRRRLAVEARKSGVKLEDYISSKAAPEMLLESLATASDQLAADFGTWRTSWGDINRFQRINDDLTPTFLDAGPSIPVGFTSAQWGSLASFGARAYPGTKRWYGTSGNSFVAVVEFGAQVKARAVTAGGESGDPASPHFNDEAQRYSTGDLRDVYFYPTQLEAHSARQYHPGN